MTALLTDNLPLLARAPNGIKKLRELILELAVRGKLVPQDASDEPVSKALDQLAREGGYRTGGGKSGRSKDSMRANATPNYSLPQAWVWVSLGGIVEVLDHLRRPVTKQDRLPGSIPYYGASGVVDYVSTHLFDEPLVLVGEDGAKWGRGEGTAFAISGRTWVNNHAHVLRPLRSVVVDDYVVYALVGADLGSFITGMTVPKLNQAKLVSIPIPLPPLAEQHRIVAKVDELMALCDTLEAQQADAESAHARLVQALLDSLTQASDAEDFAASWQRLSEHFDTLFTTEASIDALKQAVLQLAVMGKLVPQDSGDEPASELLKRIAMEKARLVSKGLIKSSNPLEAVSDSEQVFALPDSWLWVRLGEICRPISSGSTPPSELFQFNEGVPFLKVYNIRNQQIDFDYKKQFIGHDYHHAKMRRSSLNPGDIVMNIVGPPLGKVAIIPDSYPEWNCNQAIVFFGLIAPACPQYVLVYLKEGSFLDGIALVGSAGQDNISVTKSKNIAIPLPPLAEQHRIVAKVDELMSLCDQLKSRIRQARDLNQQLANTLVERTVA